MIEVSGIRVPLARTGGTEAGERRALRQAVAGRLGVRAGEVGSLELRKRSIDARRRDDVRLVYSVRVELPAARERELVARGRAAAPRDDAFSWPAPPRHAPAGRVVVVGAGCAGLFCALALARAGLAPLLVERGDDCARRTRVVAAHDATGALDPESNVQFGLGGAGTFSDGKLYTGTRARSHRAILETFVAGGAPREILWDSHPHVGSDLLPGVVDAIARQIEAAGGQLALRTRLVGLDVAAGRVRGVLLEHDGREERVASERVVLACGHSARDVFELLRASGAALERKTFAMGVRIEHPQADVDRALYGRFAGSPLLGAAPYKLAEHLPGGRSAFTFCMCPGGYVVSAASEPGGVCTNGMSLSGRDGQNANAGLLVNVTPADLPGDDVLAGVALQRASERAAFEAGGGAFVAPAQLVGDFLAGTPSTAGGAVRPTYPRGVAWGDVSGCLPPHVGDTLRAAIPRMARHLRGFDRPDAVLTAVEARSSSPVRVTRGPDGQSASVSGLFPAGEGAGYAGGIMSAAADGVRCAEQVVASLS